MTFTDPLQFVDLLDIAWYNAEAIKGLGLKLLVNLIITFTIVLLIYRPANQQAEYAFTYLIFNILIFFLCYMMINVELGLEFAFGLFALFSIMRYRTMTISIKDMTYLFAVVCVAVINSLSGDNFTIVEILGINIFIVVAIFALERLLFANTHDVKKITYEYIDRVRPDNEEELFKDIEERTGRTVVKIDIVSLNYLNDSAVLSVHFKKDRNRKRKVQYLNENKAELNGLTHQNQPSDAYEQ